MDVAKIESFEAWVLDVGARLAHLRGSFSAREKLIIAALRTAHQAGAAALEAKHAALLRAAQAAEEK